jgi:hypothetical protein
LELICSTAVTESAAISREIVAMRDCLEGLEKRLRAMSEPPSEEKGAGGAGGAKDGSRTKAADYAMDAAAKTLRDKDQDSQRDKKKGGK